MAEAIKRNYSDIFTIKAKPTTSDKAAIAGKYKTAYNLSDNLAERAASTFLALLELADLNHIYEKQSKKNIEEKSNHVNNVMHADQIQSHIEPSTTRKSSLGLHYNIQVHLPATKDIKVYNSIFKSLKDHLIG